MTQRSRSTLASALALAVLAAATAAGAADPPKDSGPGIQDVQAEAYNGPKARIAVKDFEDKMSSSGWYRTEYGRGMRDMLTTSLFQTNRYIILEREKLQGVVDELKQGTSDLFRKEATVPLGELEGAELLITAAITGFDPGTSGGGGALPGLVPGRLGGLLGGVGGGYKKATVAMDLRVIDVRTGRVVAATNTQGEATSFGVTGSSGMGGSLGGFAKTPMETAIRDMIKKSVDFVVGKTPAVYYRFGATAAAAPPAAPSGLESFLLDLGGDFTFVGRQRRLRLDDEWYRIELLFLHRRLRCLVIIDLKLGRFTQTRSENASDTMSSHDARRLVSPPDPVRDFTARARPRATLCGARRWRGGRGACPRRRRGRGPSRRPGARSSARW